MPPSVMVGATLEIISTFFFHWHLFSWWPLANYVHDDHWHDYTDDYDENHLNNHDYYGLAIVKVQCLLRQISFHLIAEFSS